MNIKHLDHLNLSVRNLDQSLAWYHKFFQFELQEQGIDDGLPWAIVRSGEALLCLYERPDSNLPSNNERRSNNILGLNHFSFRITDEKKWLETIEKHKPKLYYGGDVYLYPHSRSWYVKDPNGYEIEIVLWNNDEIHF